MFSNCEIIIIFLIAAGGVFSVAVALIQLSIKDKKTIQYLQSLMFFLYGFSILCDSYYRLGTEALAPHLLFVNYTLLYILGPVIFFYFKLLVNEKIELKPVHSLFLLPGIGSFIFFAPYYFSSAAVKLSRFPLWDDPDLVIRTMMAIIEYSLFPWIFLCFILSLRHTYFMWNHKALTTIHRIRMILIYIVLWIILVLFLVYADYAESPFLYRIGLCCTNLLVIILYSGIIRYPDFFQQLKQDINRARAYKKPHINGLNTKLIIKQIENLMMQKKVYTDNELTLKSFSSLLNITPHQLSELINIKFNMNFNHFINTYRIQAAEQMLIEKPDMTVLNIAFECGFNSKTTFNTVFSKINKISPSAFRKKRSVL